MFNSIISFFVIYLSNFLYVTLWTFNLFYVTKLQKLFDMTKPRLVKVRALFYVLQQVMKKRLRLF